MNQTNRLAVPAWIVGVLGAFALGVDTGLMAVIGYAGQWFLKAPKSVPTWAAQAGIVAVCLGCYAGLHHPAPPIEDWLVAACKWSLTALGVSSLAAGTKGAPRTDSLS